MEDGPAPLLYLPVMTKLGTELNITPVTTESHFWTDHKNWMFK